MSRLKCGDQNCTAYSRRGRTMDLYSGMISSLFLYLKLRAMNPCTLLAVSQLSLLLFATWGVCCWWFLDPAVDLLSTVVWTCYRCLARCCVRCAYIYQHWNSFATCLPTQQGCWCLPVFRYVIQVYISVRKFGMICKFRHFTDNIGIYIFICICIYIYIYIRNTWPLWLRGLEFSQRMTWCVL